MQFAAYIRAGCVVYGVTSRISVRATGEVKDADTCNVHTVQSF